MSTQTSHTEATEEPAGRCLTMNETKVERLEMRWHPALDASGRTRMEATWVAGPTLLAALLLAILIKPTVRLMAGVK